MEQVLSISLSIANLLALFVGGGIAYGKLVQKNNKTEEDVKTVKADMKELRRWGEDEIAKQVSYRESHYVTTERFNECTADIKRRLDEVNTIEINSRLARIEAMLDQIQISLEKR